MGLTTGLEVRPGERTKLENESDCWRHEHEKDDLRQEQRNKSFAGKDREV